MDKTCLLFIAGIAAAIFIIVIIRHIRNKRKPKDEQKG